MASTDRIPGIGPALCAALADIGITDTGTLAASDVARLTQLRGISAGRAEAFIAAARALSEELAEAAGPESGAAAKPGKAAKKKARKAKADKAATKADASAKKDRKTKKSGKKKSKKDRKSKK